MALEIRTNKFRFFMCSLKKPSSMKYENVYVRFWCTVLFDVFQCNEQNQTYLDDKLELDALECVDESSWSWLVSTISLEQ